MADATPNRYSLAQRDDADKKEFWACLALQKCPGLGARRRSALIARYGSAYAAVCEVRHWTDTGIPKSCVTAFGRETWRQKALLEWVAARESSCGLLLWRDAAFPPLLRAIPDAPPYLYFLGDPGLLAGPAVAVVGMRSCSEEGIKATVHIARGLARAGVTIVSGMARGIDRAAHLAGLEGPGGSIGVLGAGIDTVYPRQNGDLYALMRQKGLLLSELPPGHAVEARCFPVRNRIISGLSLAVVVVEAAVRSGSLNTARHALEQNRELMAVPGPVTASSARGCQELVRNGAKPVFCADDVLYEIAPHLAEHVRRRLHERERASFLARVDEDAAAADEKAAGEALAAPGILPWRSPDGRKTSASAAGSDGVQKGGASAVSSPAPLVPDGLSSMEQDFYRLVASAPMHIDDICRALGHSSQTISSLAAMLEVRGHVTRLPGMIYAASKT